MCHVAHCRWSGEDVQKGPAVAMGLPEQKAGGVLQKFSTKAGSSFGGIIGIANLGNGGEHLGLGGRDLVDARLKRVLRKGPDLAAKSRHLVDRGVDGARRGGGVVARRIEWF